MSFEEEKKEKSSVLSIGHCQIVMTLSPIPVPVIFNIVRIFS